MSDRGKYEGEHELQLQLLEASRDSNFTQYKPCVHSGIEAIIEGQRSVETASRMSTAKILH
jgi:hypothetical protein